MDQPQVVFAASDLDASLGFVVIDSTIRGRSRGGLRMLPDVSEHELRQLARAMTLKYGFLRLPQGGAKGGVRADPEAPEPQRRLALHRFAMAIKPLIESRGYVPDADMGTSGADIQRMLESIGVHVPRRDYRGTSSGAYTARTVFESARAAATLSDLPLTGSRVAIEGFGKVGVPLAAMFVDAGAKIVAVSNQAGGLYSPFGLDITRIAAMIAASGSSAILEYRGAEQIARDRVKFAPADLFCPCARHDSVLKEDVTQIEARVISCGANSPVARDAHRLLWERGVLCVPDFIANCGGVLGGTMEFAGWAGTEIHGFMYRHFHPRVEALIARSLQSGDPLLEATEREALDRFAEVKLRAERPSILDRAFGAALSAYREGLVPARLMRSLSESYFRDQLCG